MVTDLVGDADLVSCQVLKMGDLSSFKFYCLQLVPNFVLLFRIL